MLSDYATRLQFDAINTQLSSEYRCVSQLSDQFVQFLYTPGRHSVKQVTYLHPEKLTLLFVTN